MIGKILNFGSAARNVGEAVGNVAEVFVGNRAERDAGDLERFNRALAQFGEEFGTSDGGWFDGLVDGLNRLPRPMMAVGTLGLFAYAMVDPHGFATRMQGLAYIPEPLWWLLGAVVSFYFGARELHHYRGRKLDLPRPQPASASVEVQPRASRFDPESVGPAANATMPVTKAVAIPTPEHEPAPRPENPAASEPTYNAAFEEWRARSA